MLFSSRKLWGAQSCAQWSNSPSSWETTRLKSLYKVTKNKQTETVGCLERCCAAYAIRFKFFAYDLYTSEILVKLGVL